MCAVERSELTNTQTLFPLLVSSGLNKVILRDLWSLVNQTVPGQLTRTELFTLLGLIGLIQNVRRSIYEHNLFHVLLEWTVYCYIDGFKGHN